MSATITGSGETIRPDLVMEYRTERVSRNVYHQVIGKAEQDVSLEVDGKRYGNLRLFFSSKVEAFAAYAALALGLPYEFADSELPEVGMRFARDGRMTLELTENRRHWIIEMEYREVT